MLVPVCTEALVAVLLVVHTEVVLLLEQSVCTWFLSLLYKDTLIWNDGSRYITYKHIYINRAAVTNTSCTIYVFSNLQVASIGSKEARKSHTKKECELQKCLSMSLLSSLALPLPPLKSHIYGLGL